MQGTNVQKNYEKEMNYSTFHLLVSREFAIMKMISKGQYSGFS